jgi:hypothetical protein
MAVLALATTLGLTASAQAQPAPRRVAFVGELGPMAPTVRPKAIGYILASKIDRLVWSQWGPDKAVGRGYYEDCYTGCGPGASGPQRVRAVPTTVVLTQPINTTEGWLFNQMTVAVKGWGRPMTTTEASNQPWVVVLPTPANMTGNYLWSDGTSGYLWLQLRQSGTRVSGTGEDATTQDYQLTVSDFNVSGVASRGAVSLVLAPTAGSTSSPATIVFDLVGLDLRVEGTPFGAVISLVPASWDSYWAVARAVRKAS